MVSEAPGASEAIVVSARSEEHTSDIQSPGHLVCRLLLEKKYLTSSLGSVIAVVSPSLSVSRIEPLLLTVSAFFFNDTATTEIYTLSLHDALPILLLMLVWLSMSLCVTS